MRRWAPALLGVTLAAASATAAERVELSKSIEIVAFKAKARVEVKSVTLDFWPSGPVLGDPRKKGRQFVRVEIAVTNTGSEAHSLSYTAFELSCSEEPRVTQTPYVNKGNSADRLASAKLQPGQSATGAIYFEVGRRETVATLALLTSGYERGRGEVKYTIPFGSTAASESGAPASAARRQSAGAAAAAAAPAPHAPASQPADVGAAVTQWIGTAKDGWTPVAFAALRSGMSPAEAGQVFPGAETLLGRTNASKVRLSGLPFVQELQFNFMKDRPDGQKGLAHVILTFERGAFDDAGRRAALVQVLEAKFGPMRPGPNALTKGFWNPRIQGQERIAQFVDWGRGQDVQLSFDLATGDASATASAPAPAPTPTRVVSTSVTQASCRAVDAATDATIVEASGASVSACNAAVKDKLRAARCASGAASVTYKLQQWAVGRWSNGVRLTLSCP